MPLYVGLGIYPEETKEGDDHKISAFSAGMSVFGKLEMEVIGTGLDPNGLLGFMYTICEYVISEDVTLQDGETIGFSENDKIPIHISEGAAVPGQTIKLG